MKCEYTSGGPTRPWPDFLDTLAADLCDTTTRLGFEFWGYELNIPLPLSAPRQFSFNNFPLEWRHCYARKNYRSVDPTIVHGRSSSFPLIWDAQLFSACPALWMDAQSHGIGVGWTQPCRGARGVHGIFTLARAGVPLHDDELKYKLTAMMRLAERAHLAFSKSFVHMHLPEMNVHLSRKEREVLRWSGDGKTSSEVGMLMYISERTVNFHINNALQKLNASNKVSAVIKAELLGLL